MVTCSGRTSRKPPLTATNSVLLPFFKRTAPICSGATIGMWPGKIPSSPVRAFVLTISTFPSYTGPSGVTTLTLIVRMDLAVVDPGRPQPQRLEHRGQVGHVVPDRVVRLAVDLDQELLPHRAEHPLHFA